MDTHKRGHKCTPEALFSRLAVILSLALPLSHCLQGSLQQWVADVEWFELSSLLCPLLAASPLPRQCLFIIDVDPKVLKWVHNPAVAGWRHEREVSCSSRTPLAAHYFCCGKASDSYYLSIMYYHTVELSTTPLNRHCWRIQTSVKGTSKVHWGNPV